MQAVWPAHAVEKLSWGHVKWAHADLRVLIDAPEDAPKPGLACHVGIYFRDAMWDGRKVHIGGIGGVSTRPDCRGRGYASLALNAAVRTMRDHEAVRFAMLFCEPHNEAFYQARGWHAFRARSMPSSRRDECASRRWRRSCSILPASRATESSTYAACRGDPCIRSGWLALVGPNNMSVHNLFDLDDVTHDHGRPARHAPHRRGSISAGQRPAHLADPADAVEAHAAQCDRHGRHDAGCGRRDLLYRPARHRAARRHRAGVSLSSC